MRWSRWKTSFILIIMLNLVTKSAYAATSQYNQNFKISPKPCDVSGIDGTCMFVWECIKSEGVHLGMCMDGFMFGSCCGHNLTDNFILPPSTPFRRPNKPTSPIRNRPARPPSPGIQTIQRPNGGGTLVIRQKPQKIKTTTQRPASTKNPLDNFNDSSNELSGSASVSAGKFENKFYANNININIIQRFVVVDAMASDHRTEFHNKTTPIIMGQDNTSKTQAKANEKTYNVRLNSSYRNTKAHNI